MMLSQGRLTLQEISSAINLAKWTPQAKLNYTMRWQGTEVKYTDSVWAVELFSNTMWGSVESA